MLRVPITSSRGKGSNAWKLQMLAVRHSSIGMQEALELAKEQEADILVFGHSHKYSVQTIGKTLLYINPGSA
jgi:predicted phosphodiesterase